MAKVSIKFSETTPAQRSKMICDLGKRLDMNESLDSLIAEMRGFEKKYRMSTVEFYAQFTRGTLTDCDRRDYIRWAGDYHQYHRILKRHFARKAVFV